MYCWPFPLGFWGIHSAYYLCIPAQESGCPKVTHLVWCKCSWPQGHSGCRGFFCTLSGEGVWKCVTLQQLCRVAFLFCASPHLRCSKHQKFLRHCQHPNWWCHFPQRCSEEMLWICPLLHAGSIALILRWSNFCQQLPSIVGPTCLVVGKGCLSISLFLQLNSLFVHLGVTLLIAWHRIKMLLSSPVATLCFCE